MACRLFTIYIYPRSCGQMISVPIFFSLAFSQLLVEPYMKYSDTNVHTKYCDIFHGDSMKFCEFHSNSVQIYDKIWHEFHSNFFSRHHSKRRKMLVCQSSRGVYMDFSLDQLSFFFSVYIFGCRRRLNDVFSLSLVNSISFSFYFSSINYVKVIIFRLMYMARTPNIAA